MKYVFTQFVDLLNKGEGYALAGILVMAVLSMAGVIACLYGHNRDDDKRLGDLLEARHDEMMAVVKELQQLVKDNTTAMEHCSQCHRSHIG